MSICICVDPFFDWFHSKNVIEVKELMANNNNKNYTTGSNTNETEEEKKSNGKYDK